MAIYVSRMHYSCDTLATATSTSSITLLVAKKLGAKSDAKGIHYGKEYA
jgi:hypothetical protein